MRVVYDANYNYEELFRKAEVTLDLGKNTIETLAHYYEHIDDLLDQSPEFLRIPLDEDLFEINTTTRKIKIPDNVLTTNSANNENNKWIIGVQNDHMAEVLFFKVDRFFDGQDLAVCFPNPNPGKDEAGNDLPPNYKGQTYVQWKNGTAKGLDAVTYVEIQEETIYFGWVLTTGRKGAKDGGPLSHSGDLTFSISFVYHNAAEDKEPDLESAVLFSFNTLPVTCRIAENLLQSMGEVNNMSSLDVEDISNQSIARPRFSGIFNNILGPKPRITKELPVYANLDENGELILTIEATVSGDPNKLEYKWSHNGEPIGGANEKTYTVKSGKDIDPTGIYTAMAGYRYAEDKIRYDESACTVPGPAEIRFAADNGNLIHSGLANGLTPLTVDVETVIKYEYDQEPGEMIYKWYREPLEGEVLDIINPIAEGTDTIIPNEGDTGIYYVVVTNKKNTKEGPALESNHAIMKAPAATPTDLRLERNDNENYIKAVFDIQHRNDIWYNWSVSNINNPTDIQGSTGWVQGQDTYVITGPGVYSCYVQQRIYPIGTTDFVNTKPISEAPMASASIQIQE